MHIGITISNHCPNYDHMETLKINYFFFVLSNILSSIYCKSRCSPLLSLSDVAINSNSPQKQPPPQCPGHFYFPKVVLDFLGHLLHTLVIFTFQRLFSIFLEAPPPWLYHCLVIVVLHYCSFSETFLKNALIHLFRICSLWILCHFYINIITNSRNQNEERYCDQRPTSKPRGLPLVYRWVLWLVWCRKIEWKFCWTSFDEDHQKIRRKVKPLLLSYNKYITTTYS